MRDEYECYCDFAARRFFGCQSNQHVPPCPQPQRTNNCECEACVARSVNPETGNGEGVSNGG